MNAMEAIKGANGWASLIYKRSFPVSAEDASTGMVMNVSPRDMATQTVGAGQGLNSTLALPQTRVMFFSGVSKALGTEVP